VQYALVIVQSVQAEHDYGAYQTARRAAWRFEQAYCAALLQELPRLINTLPDWAGDFLVGIANGAGTPHAPAITCFNTLLAAARRRAGADRRLHRAGRRRWLVRALPRRAGRRRS
jgi:hypothetical protein